MTDPHRRATSSASTELCDELLAEHDPKTTPPAEFLGAQYDLGLAWVHFPEGYGGLGLSPKLQNDDQRRSCSAAGAPLPYGAQPDRLRHVRADDRHARQRRAEGSATCARCSPAKRSGARCSASPAPAPTSRASRRARSATATSGSLNGQKVWTTLAHVSRFGIVLARTDPETVKHKGMTMFVIDMHAPGVEVRPLVQATGEAEFNEVYMTDVRIPDGERLGDVGEGWHVSLTTLMNERVSIGGQVAPARQRHHRARDATRASSSNRRGDAVARDQLAQFWIEAEVNRLTNMRASQMRAKGTPGPEGSVGKMAMAGLNQRLMSFVMDLMGPEAMLYPAGYPMDRPTTAMDLSNPQKAFLRVQANSIEGGTTNIMKNILGERVLGLPGEPRADKDVPWSQVPRS